MSLPKAPKDVREHPTKGSVVAPVDKAAKDADVDRKLRFYGVIQAFRQGRLPSNQQINHTLDYVLNHSPVDVDQLSPEGRKLVQDTRDIISSARLIVNEKNADELFQNFVWHTRDVDRSALQTGTLDDHAPIDAQKAKQDSDEAVRHLRTLLTLVLTNSEARKLLSDFSVIGRDLLAKGASKAASNIAPPEDRLATVDHTAPNDQFITEGGRIAGPNEKPVLEGKIPFTNKTVKRHPDDEDFKLRHPTGEEQNVGEIREAGREQFESVQDEARRRAGGAMEDRDATRHHASAAVDKGKAHAKEALRTGDAHASDVRESSDPEAELDAKKRGMMGRMKQMKDNIFDRVPQEHKDRASEQYDRGRHFLSEEYFPEERRDQFIFRGKKVIMECQKHEDYQNSIRWLLGYIEEYAKHGRVTVQNGQEHVRGTTKQSSLNIAFAELRTLLERFANGATFNPIIDAINALIDDARRDDALREWFKAVDLYIRKVLLEPGYVLEPDCNNHGNRLKDMGREFYDVKYRDHFDHLFNTIGDWFKAMGDDPLNRQFGQDWARLTKDLLFDSDGNLQFKRHLWDDIRKVIFPQLIQHIGYIPIPRIEYSDDSLDLVVENLTLEGRNLFPNIISFDAQNYIRFSPYDSIKDDNHHRFTLHLEQMQADMRDVAFYYRKKTGMPKMRDSGIADVIIGGHGVSAVVHLASSTKDRSSVFKVHDVQVKVDTLKFAIRDSKHDFLYKTLRPLATGLIKRQIQKAITQALRTGLEYVDGQLVTVRDRIDVAKSTEGQTRTDVLKDLFKHKTDEASMKSAETKSKFKIVTDKRNSMLADAGHGDGYLNQAMQKKEVAAAGNEWRSEAFNVV
jgi:hypothetical protein